MSLSIGIEQSKILCYEDCHQEAYEQSKGEEKKGEDVKEEIQEYVTITLELAYNNCEEESLESKVFNNKSYLNGKHCIVIDLPPEV